MIQKRLESLLRHLTEHRILQEGDWRLAPTSLSRLTTFHTGGACLALYPQSISALTALVKAFREEKLPFYLLGNGSNVIAPDEGYDGVVVVLTDLKQCEVSKNRLTAQCGASLTSAAVTAQHASLGGMEFCYGIPGTVGGAVFMNAGAYGGECKDILESVTYLTKDGRIQTLPPQDLEMGYRTSIFQSNGAVILSATFLLAEKDREEIRAEMDRLMALRIEKQPLDYPSAGSTFKRCEGRFTAKMIEDAGLKGERVGGAMVSEKHAGFVINYDRASSADILTLIERIRSVILEKEGVLIQPEVRILQ